MAMCKKSSVTKDAVLHTERKDTTTASSTATNPMHGMTHTPRGVVNGQRVHFEVGKVLDKDVLAERCVARFPVAFRTLSVNVIPKSHIHTHTAQHTTPRRTAGHHRAR